MNSSGQSKHQIFHMKRGESTQNLVINLQTITKAMQNYLNTISRHSYNYDKLTKKENLKQLIEAYSQVLTQIKQQTKNEQDLYIKQLKYYKQHISQKQQKIKELNQEVISSLKALSHREEEISQNQADIFQLKLLLEQKEKTILQLVVKLKKKAKEQLLKNMANNQKNQIKIVVNEPIRKVVQKQQILIEQSYQKVQTKQNAKEWTEERKNLLKVLKEKDLKIYHLIQQLNELKLKK